MNPKVKIRGLGIEAILFVLLLIIGFATFHASRLERELQEEKAALEVSAKSFKKAKAAFKEAQVAFSEQPPPVKSDLREAPQIKEKYLELAEVIKIREVQKALLDFGKSPKIDRKSETLKEKMELWTDSWQALTNRFGEDPNLLQQSLKLKELIEEEIASETNALVPVSKDLAQWIEKIEPVSSNYFSNIETFRKKAPAMKRDDSAEAQDLLVKQAGALFGIGKKLQADATAIDFFVKTNSAREMIKQSGILSKVANLELPSVPVLKKKIDFEKLFYPLVLGAAGLLALWVALCYRRLVILPLREQLTQKEAIIQQKDMFAHFSGLAVKLAHETKNLMTIFYARLYTLQKRIPKDTPEYADSEVIKEQVDHLNQIVRDFLAVSNPAEPKLVLTNAEDLLSNVQAMLAPQLEAKSIRLKSEAESDVIFPADSEQLNRVLINLVQNAAESIEHDGAIILRARQDRMDLNAKNSKVIVLEVEDDGPGVPPGLQERLFDPFFSTKTTGTGLGLAISAQIIQKHSGSLTFESERGKTVFRIVLPRK